VSVAGGDSLGPKPATGVSIEPTDVDVGSGVFYVPDAVKGVVRRVSVLGFEKVVAGNGTNGYSGDGGPATSAELNEPGAVAVDLAGNVLIADTGNNRVRLVAAKRCTTSCPYGLSSMKAGYIYTIVGDGIEGATRATAAQPQRPSSTIRPV
jgi:hypothetical protein